MTFAARITRAPRPFDEDRAQEAADRFTDLAPEVVEVLKGAAGCAPYLSDLLKREDRWLHEEIGDPELSMDRVMAMVRDTSLAELPDVLREAKRRVALMTALADLGGVWPLETVTRTLSTFAAAAVDQTVRKLVQAEIERGKLPGLGADDIKTAGGMSVLAMGKMGAGELNYSSDIDLICLFDETRFEPDDYHDARAAFIRVTRKMTAILSDVSAGGYVFRTDLRLRPDASVTPVCLSMEAAERYYESVGRTWERAAYIKACAAAGDISAGERFLEMLTPFVWRKHLDFAAIQDAHDMRLRIRDHKGLSGKLILDGHDMKLGRGGIREIEFFTQTRQLIAGGRDPTLRVRDTVGGLAKLAGADWIPEQTAQTLTERYREHREVEHRLQMLRDAQTHHLPSDAEGFARLAAFMGQDVAELRNTLTARLEEVHELTEGFFAPDAAPAPRSNWGEATVARWQTYPALRSTRANEIFQRLWPDIQERLQKAARPDEALAEFDGFLAGLPAGVQLFSLFEANPQLTQLIVDVAASAPALAQYLSRNAGVLDAVIGGGFFEDWPKTRGLRAALAEKLEQANDYEAQLITARRWAREWHFRIGVHHLRGLIDAEAAGRQYADLAEAILAALWPIAVKEFTRKHGAPPGQGATILGMGSLGAARLNAMSDLDLIVIYDGGEQEFSDGRRPLATRTYFARLTQAFVTALSAPMAEGRLYEVDMRLRPSGRQGPVATSLDAFCNYQQNEAWTWEHLALTRARPVAGSVALGQAVDDFRERLLREKSAGAAVQNDVQDMRHRLRAAKPGQGVWDVKSGPGRQQDIELFAQSAALLGGSAEREITGQLAAGVASGWMDDADARALEATYRLLWNVQATARLLAGGVFDPEAVGEGGRQMMLRETGENSIEALAASVSKACETATVIIDRRLGAQP